MWLVEENTNHGVKEIVNHGYTLLIAQVRGSNLVVQSHKGVEIEAEYFRGTYRIVAVVCR